MYTKSVTNNIYIIFTPIGNENEKIHSIDEEMRLKKVKTFPKVTNFIKLICLGMSSKSQRKNFRKGFQILICLSTNLHVLCLAVCFYLH